MQNGLGTFFWESQRLRDINCDAAMLYGITAHNVDSLEIALTTFQTTGLQKYMAELIGTHATGSHGKM